MTLDERQGIWCYRAAFVDGRLKETQPALRTERCPYGVNEADAIGSPLEVVSNLSDFDLFSRWAGFGQCRGQDAGDDPGMVEVNAHQRFHLGAFFAAG